MSTNYTHDDGRVVLAAKAKPAEKHGVTVMVHAHIPAPPDDEEAR